MWCGGLQPAARYSPQILAVVRAVLCTDAGMGRLSDESPNQIHRTLCSYFRIFSTAVPIELRACIYHPCSALRELGITVYPGSMMANMNVSKALAVTLYCTSVLSEAASCATRTSSSKIRFSSFLDISKKHRQIPWDVSSETCEMMKILNESYFSENNRGRGPIFQTISEFLEKTIRPHMPPYMHVATEEYEGS